ncbi:MAG: universal stress protein [Rhodobacteraceae bacterium]|nr:universal stress protein [Paracoccaceae bacterium]
MIKSILCAVDISQPQVETNVLKVAAEFAKNNDARLDVISVIPDYGMSIVGSFFSEDHTRKAISKAKEALSTLVKGVVGTEANEKVRHIVATGSAYEEILKLAEAAKTDLIVIGAHKPDFKDYLLGPNAARVVRHSKCSVYVVR